MKIETTQIRELPIAQKIELLELVSEAIFQDSSTFQSPEWHDDILKIREAELSDESQWLSLDDLRKSLREPTGGLPYEKSVCDPVGAGLRARPVSL